MRVTLICTCLLIGLWSCDRSDDIPSYVHITNFDVISTADQGSDDHKITDAWVYVNGKSIGAYQVPITIPVLAEGETQIIIFPGIKENGVRGLPIIYPLYDQYNLTLNLSPSREDTIRPVVKYKDNLEFIILEDFEGTNFFTKDYDGNDGTKIEQTRADVFEGNESGLIVLNEDTAVLEAAWHEFKFAPPGGEIFAEINYKSNIPFIIGIKGYRAGIPTNYYDAIINSKDEWNKIYFNFSHIINDQVMELYELVIVGIWDETFDVDEAEILIDNVKLIRQE